MIRLPRLKNAMPAPRMLARLFSLSNVLNVSAWASGYDHPTAKPNTKRETSSMPNDSPLPMKNGQQPETMYRTMAAMMEVRYLMNRPVTAPEMMPDGIMPSATMLIT